MLAKGASGFFMMAAGRVSQQPCAGALPLRRIHPPGFSLFRAGILQLDAGMSRCCHFLCVLALILGGSAPAANSREPFPVRGYYTTFMRMPTFGLPEWKQMIDAMEKDGANFLILWTAGGFRSKQFPITWKYNADHKNVQQDFARELIDYAHTKQIRVVLGFTPFAYDGANQYPLEHPELKATQKNGTLAKFWGLHAWGYNLCPSRGASQKFMRDYVREMFFEFYPNADGLLIESSDYAICYCSQCQGKFFDREFDFVRQISDDVWRVKTNATIFVYPHYFSAKAVPEFGVAGSKQKFDPRWSLSFTPHSAHIDDELAQQAKSALYWNDGLTIGTPTKIRDGARTARERALSGYITSCEPFSCIDGPLGSNKPRLKPFHFEWLRDGEMPLNELLIRVNRIAYREYTANPGLSEDAFRAALGKEIFGARAGGQNIGDLLFLQDCWFNGAEWFTPALFLRPAEFKRRAQREKWSTEKMQSHLGRVERLRAIAKRYEASTQSSAREMARIATLVVSKWDEANQ